MKINLAHQQTFAVEILLIDGVYVSSEIFVQLTSNSFKSHELPAGQYCKECDPLTNYLKTNLKINDRGCDDGTIEVVISLTPVDRKFRVKIEGDPLAKLTQLFDSDIRVKIEISDVFVDGRSLVSISSRKLIIESEGQTHFCEGLMPCPSDWRELWLSKKERLRIGGKLCVQVCSDKLPKSVSSGNGNGILNAVNKKILHEQIATDVQCIAGNGATVSCHKSFLLAHSQKFAMTNTRGWNTVIFDDMTEPGVKAMLKYLYYRDLEDPKRNPAIAMELLRCATKYQLESLETDVKEIKP